MALEEGDLWGLQCRSRPEHNGLGEEPLVRFIVSFSSEVRNGGMAVLAPGYLEFDLGGSFALERLALVGGEADDSPPVECDVQRPAGQGDIRELEAGSLDGSVECTPAISS